MDPARAEEKESSASITLVFDNREAPLQIAASTSKGRLPQDAFIEAVKTSREAAAKNFQFFKAALRRKIEASTTQAHEADAKEETETVKKEVKLKVTEEDSEDEEVSEEDI